MVFKFVKEKEEIVVKSWVEIGSMIADLNTQWGAFFAVAGGVAYAFSPVYKGLTVQFKTYVSPVASTPLSFYPIPSNLRSPHTPSYQPLY